MSLTFKLGSLAIRTLAKPISNYIKRNAREHERFKNICVAFAQRLHRIDMRLRLGLLQDPAAIERQIQRELKEAERKRVKDAAPTVKTEEETKADEQSAKKERKDVEDHVKAASKPKIRPLSESKAIDSGANFIAETFLFVVAGGLILLESWRRDRKEKKQDAEVADALNTAEVEREELKMKLELLQAEIEALMDKKPFEDLKSIRAAASASIRDMPTANASVASNASKTNESLSKDSSLESTSRPNVETLATVTKNQPISSEATTPTTASPIPETSQKPDSASSAPQSILSYFSKEGRSAEKPKSVK